MMKAQSVNKFDFNKIKLNKLIVWSKIGNGTITFLREELQSLGFHVFEIRPYQYDDKGFKPSLKEKLDTIRDNGEKIAFVFDEISYSYPEYSELFKETIINNQFKLFSLNDEDIVIGSGRIDTENNFVKSGIAEDVLAYVEHYKVSH